MARHYDNLGYQSISDILADIRVSTQIADSSSFIDEFREASQELFEGLVSSVSKRAGRYFVSTMASFGILVHQLRAIETTHAGRIAAVTQFVLAVTDGLVENACEWIGNILAEAIKSFWPSGEYHSQGLLDKVENVWSTLITGSFFCTIRDFFLVVASNKWFGKDFTNGYRKYIGKLNGKMSLTESITRILQSFKFFLRYGEAIINGTPVTDVLFAKDPIGLAFDKMNNLMLYSERLYLGLPVEGYMCARQFRQESEELLKTSEVLIREMSPLDLRREGLKRLRLQLEQAHLAATCYSNSGSRHAPIGVVLHGDPKIGKSKLVEVFPRIMSHIKNRQFDSSHVYSRNVGEEYWEGYHPASHPYLHYAEVGNEHANMVHQVGPSIMSEIQKVIDGTAYPVKMAFEDKGKVFADPELVVIDTNNPTMNIEKIMFAPAAMYRRFLFVHATVKPEFRELGATSLDSSASLNADGWLLDRYDFHIYYHKPKGNVRTEVVTVARGDIHKMINTVHAHFIAHLNKQDRISSNVGMDHLNDILNLKDMPRDETVFNDMWDHKHDDDSGPDGIDELDVKAELDELDGYVPDGFGLGFSEEENKSCAFEEQETTGWNDLHWNGPVYSQGDISHALTYEHMLEYGKEMFIALSSLLLYFSVAQVIMISLPPKVKKWIVLAYMLIVLYIRSHTFTMLSLLASAFLYFYADYLTEVSHNKINSTVQDHVKARFQYYKRRTVYLLGWAVFTPFANNALEVGLGHVFVCLGATAATVAVIKLWRLKEKHFSESVTVFEKYSPHNEEINRMEELSEVEPTRVRVKTKLHPAWNTARGVYKPGVFTGGAVELSTLLSRNLYNCKTTSDGNSYTRVHVLGVKSTYALINKHAFQGKDEIVIHWSSTGVFLQAHQTSSVTIKLEDCIDMGNDVVMIDMQILQFRDIVKHFADMDVPELSGAINQQAIVIRRTKRPVTAHDRLAGKTIIDDVLAYDCDHADGMCGTPVVAQTTKSLAGIVGIHSAGSGTSSVGIGSRITKDQIIKAVETLEQNSLLLPLYSQGEMKEEFEPPVPKSPFSHEYMEYLDYLGKLSGVPIMINQHSRMQRSGVNGLSRFFRDTFGFERSTVYGIPSMRPRMRNGEWQSPWNLALRKMNKPQPEYDVEVLDKVISRLVDRIVTGLNEKGIYKMTPISMDEAINGSESDAFLRRINAATSVGYPFEGPKCDYMPLCEDGVTREALGIFKERVAKAFECYERGEAVHFVYRAALKDEPRELQKCQDGKTRVFYMTPLDLLIVARMILSPLYTSMVENPEIYCTAVGIDMLRGADDLVRRLMDFSPDVMEGDYSGYDVSMPLFVARGASTVMYKVLERMQYNDHALMLLQGLLTDSVLPFVNMNTDIFCKPGMQPSGKYGTAEDNSLRGLLLLMYAWYITPELTDLDFFDYVLPVTYGDDLLAAVKSDVQFYYNNNTYQRKVEDCFGMGFTSAAKTLDLQPFMNVNNMSFLKRTFVYDEKFGKYKALLDMNSIYKMLEWEIPSKSVPPFAQATGCIKSALIELYQHCEDEEDYLKCASFLEDYMVSRFGKHEVNYIWSYIELENLVHEGVLPLEMKDSVYDDILDEENFMTQSDPSEDLEDMDNVAPPVLIAQRVARRAYQDYIQGRLNFDDLNPEGDSFIVFDFDDTYFTESSLEMKVDASEIEVMETLIDFTGSPTESVGGDTEMLLMDIGEEAKYIEDFFSRPVLIESFDLLIGTHENRSVFPWDLLSREPSVRAKLRNFAFFRGSLHVRVAVSGSPFHYGKLLVSYQPCGNANDNITQHIGNISVDGASRNLFLNYLSQSPEARVIDVRKNTVAEFNIPYISPKAMASLFNESSSVLSAATPYNDMQDMGEMFFYTINEVLAIGATPTSVAVKVYAYFTDVQLGCPTATQIDITTESEVSESLLDERDQGPVERITMRMATVAEWLTYVPPISSLAKASKMMLTGMGKIASLYGFSRPSIISEPTYVKNRPFANGANVIGSETLERIVLDPKQELTIDPRVCGVDTDDMVIAQIASRESYLTSFSWTAADAELVPIWKCGVHPNLCTYYNDGLGNYIFQPTALAFAATPFLWWRGKIIFRIEVVCSNYHRGKLGVLFEPNAYQEVIITSDLHLNKNFMGFIDLQETQDVPFCVEMAIPRAWASGMSGESSRLLYGVDENIASIASFVNGFITVFPFTQLQSNDSSSIEVNIYVRGEEMQFNQLSESYLPQQREMLSQGEHSMRLLGREPVCEVLNPVGSSPNNTTTYHFGEQPLSFRSLLKRYASDEYLAHDFALASVNFGVKAPIYSSPRPAYNDGGLPIGPTLMSYLMYAYLGMRGSVRKRVRFLHSGSYYQQGYTVASLSDTSLSGYSTYESALPSVSLQRGSIPFVPDTNGGVEFEIPNYSVNLFTFAFNEDHIGDLMYAQTRNYTVECEGRYSSTNDGFVGISTAIGEDFSFMRFQGGPMFSATP